jgi:hypothetical protein
MNESCEDARVRGLCTKEKSAAVIGATGSLDTPRGQDNGFFRSVERQSIARKVELNELVVAMMIRGSRTSDVARIAASTGYQSVIVDLEHSTMALDVVAEMVATANDHGVVPFVHVPERD